MEEKYKFCLHVPGEFNDGLNSLVRGEGRWTMKMGYVLAQHGHDVTLVGTPGRGSIPGCKIATWNDYHRLVHYGPYNFFIDSCWYKAIAPRNCGIPAEVYLRCFWGVDEQYDTIRQDYYDYRHWASYPTKEVWYHLKNHKNAKYARFLPTPMVESVKNISNFDKNFIFWPLKNPFEFKHMIKLAEYMFNLMLEMSRKHNLKPVILFSDCIDPQSQWGPLTPGYIGDIIKRAKRNGAQKTENGVSFLDTEIGYIFSGGVPHSFLMSLLSRSKLMITNGDPPASPIYVESVSEGCLPLVWGQALFSDVPEKEGVALVKQLSDTFDLDYCDRKIKPLVDRFLSDSLFYEDILGKFQAEARAYEHETACNILMDSFTELLTRVRRGEDA